MASGIDAASENLVLRERIEVPQRWHHSIENKELFRANASILITAIHNIFNMEGGLGVGSSQDRSSLRSLPDILQPLKDLNSFSNSDEHAHAVPPPGAQIFVHKVADATLPKIGSVSYIGFWI